MRIDLHIEQINIDGPALPHGGTDSFRGAFEVDLVRALRDLPRTRPQPHDVEACVADSISRVLAPDGGAA